MDYKKELQKLKKENDKLKSENNKLKEENEELKKNVNTLQNINQVKNEYLQKKAEEYYDLIIDIDSINSLENKGWEIILNKDRQVNYQDIISAQTIKIGVLGMNNVGKSYLLSKLSNAEIPIGYSIETKGISIKYLNDTKEEEKISK